MPDATVIETLKRRFPPGDRTIAGLLLHRARSAPDRPLLHIGGQDYTAATLALRASAMANRMARAGVGRGDRVAILCGNRIAFIDLLLGCAWLGAVAVPINTAARGPQLRHILVNSGAHLLAIEAVALPALDLIEREGLALEHIWPLAEGDEALSPFNVAPVATGPADLSAIIYTSGTTGPSKGVCCPQAQFFWWAAHSIDILGIDESDVLLTSLPLFHVNALASFYSALVADAKLVVLERFSASGFSRTLIQHEATVTYLLGAMVSILLSTPEQPGDSAHNVRRALAPGVTAHAQAAFTARFGMGLVDGYGSTESNFVIGAALGDQAPGSMGRLRPGFTARVADESDNDMPDTTPGELLLRADDPFALASGYFNLPEQTVAAWRNLWFHTGDRVWRDADGNYYFMDRIKDAIRRRGENISAYEVEQVLLGHPAIAQAAVFPVPSELGEDEVMAAIILHPEDTATPEAILDFCQPRMAYFSVPRFVLLTDSLPLTENGKIQKFRLRERGITPDTWDREVAGYQVLRPGKAALA